MLLDFGNEENSAILQIMQNISSRTVKGAAMIITIMPILCVYPFLQKYFTKGSTVVGKTTAEEVPTMKVLLILTAWMQAAALLLMVLLVVLRGRRSCPECGRSSCGRHVTPPPDSGDTPPDRGQPEEEDQPAGRPDRRG